MEHSFFLFRWIDSIDIHIYKKGPTGTFSCCWLLTPTTSHGSCCSYYQILTHVWKAFSCHLPMEIRVIHTMCFGALLSIIIVGGFISFSFLVFRAGDCPAASSMLAPFGSAVEDSKPLEHSMSESSPSNSCRHTCSLCQSNPYSDHLWPIPSSYVKMEIRF